MRRDRYLAFQIHAAAERGEGNHDLGRRNPWEPGVGVLACTIFLPLKGQWVSRAATLGRAVPGVPSDLLRSDAPHTGDERNSKSDHDH